MTNAGPSLTDRPGRTFLQGLLDLPATPSAERMGLTAEEDAVAQGLAVAKVYAFLSIDYPGAAASWVFDSDGNGAAGGFGFDAPSPISPFTAFTFTDGAYQILAVPNSTFSMVTGFSVIGSWSNGSGSHGFLLQSGVFTTIDFPLATRTTPLGINDTGEIAGYYNTAGGNTHGFIYSAGAFSTIDVAGARHTFLTSIQNDGLITGACIDALNEPHGLIGK